MLWLEKWRKISCQANVYAENERNIFLVRVEQHYCFLITIGLAGDITQKV